MKYSIYLLLLVVMGCGRHVTSDELTSAKKESQEQAHISNVTNDFDSRIREAEPTLSTQTPGWLTIGPTVSADATKVNLTTIDLREAATRPMGRSTKIVLQGRTINLPESELETTWVSISPNGRRILVERGSDLEIAAVNMDGSVSAESRKLPNMNYSSAAPWYLTRWVWLSDSEIVSALNRPNLDGDSIAESRLYHYDVKGATLREILLPDGFVNPDDPYLEVIGVSERALKLKTLDSKGWFNIPGKP